MSNIAALTLCPQPVAGLEYPPDGGHAHGQERQRNHSGLPASARRHRVDAHDSQGAVCPASINSTTPRIWAAQVAILEYNEFDPKLAVRPTHTITLAIIFRSMLRLFT